MSAGSDSTKLIRTLAIVLPNGVEKSSCGDDLIGT